MKLKPFIILIFCFVMFRAMAQTYNYAEALQKSLYFYDAEKCGPGITGARLTWRGDCHLKDMILPLNEEMTNMSSSFISSNLSVLDPDGNGTVDVSGGFHDAGDHVQFGLPQSYSTSTLEWALYEFRDAFVETGELEHMKEILRWGADYYLRCSFSNGSGDIIAFCYQVGEGNEDHNIWGPPELLGDVKRPAYFATSETPASDQCAGAAASLALTYLNFKPDDATYANKCLGTAKALYEFATDNRGLGYSGGFYNSSFDEDELAWAAIWLHIATGEESYLTDIISIDADGFYTGWLGKIIRSTQDQWQNIWVHSWDTKWGGVFAKLAPITNDPFHWWIFRWNLEYWAGGPHEGETGGSYIATTPAGFSFLNSWGSARYNAAAQFQGMVYKKYANSDVFDNWMTSQMQYIMGNNPLKKSYIVGYSDNYAEHPHHRAAHGSPNNSMFDPPEHKHILWGALVGGPGADDEHVDETRDFIYNEVAIDYNAGLVGALAGHHYYFGEGQKPIADFPPADAPLIEYKVAGKIEQENEQRSQISIEVTNESAFPPRKDVQLSAKYYFDISELAQYDQTINDISAVIYYDENATNGSPITMSGPIALDAANGIYYIEFTWPEEGFYGSRELQFGLIAKQDNITYTAHWDPTNDYSHIDLNTTELTDNGRIPLYANGVLVSGNELNHEPISVTGVTVAPTAATISSLGGTTTIKATVSPSNADDKSVTWSSSNTAVATVSSNGLITAISEGEATITVTTTDGGFNATSEITVDVTTTIPVTGISVTPTSATIASIGGTSALTAAVTPSNATNKSVTWSSSNTAVATVNASGVVTAVSEGDAIITATTVDGGYEATATITVEVGTNPSPCENPVTATLPLTENGAGEYCWVTSGTINYVNSWNMDLVEVNGIDFTNKWSGNMPAMIDGKYYIYYKSSVGWAHLEVNGSGGTSDIPVTGVTVAPTTATISSIGGTATLTATLAPSNATNKSITWSSSNTAVATVNNNAVVTAVSEGTTTITVTTVDGSFTASSAITVDVTTTIPVTGVNVTPISATITSTGGTVALTATVTPSNATNKSITWSSSNTAAATVNSSGVVTAIANGDAIIIVTTADGSYTATSAITVEVGSNPEPCDNPVSISIPFTKDGAGEFCYSTSQEIAYINSWNMDLVEINGVDFTNKWSNSFPAAIDGKWYIYYKASVSWAHFEAPAAKGTVGLTEINNSLKIYPNPAINGNFTIEHDGIEVNNVDIYNLQGGLVFTQKLNTRKENINPGLVAGTYILKVNELTQLLVIE